MLSTCVQVMEAAQSLEHKSFFTGGNAALMGTRFAKEGSVVLLGGAVGNQSKPLLPKEFKIANQNGKDEIHLIMEFSRGEIWGALVAPRDNRLIVHCDYTNSRVSVLEGFHLALNNFKADLLVIAGLHLLEREEPIYRTTRLKTVLDSVTPLSEHVPIHLELASIADLNFLSELGNTILPHVESMGLNEQELGYLYLSLGGDTDDEHQIENIKRDFKDPTVETVVDALSFIFKHLDILYENKQHSRRFGRIHFHSLKYHIVAQKPGTGWEPGAKSVAAGALTASVQSCQFDADRDDPEKQFLLPFDDIASNLDQMLPVQQWTTKNGIEFYLAPVLVCKAPAKTVGLGDAISSMGLLYHQFYNKNVKKSSKK